MKLPKLSTIMERLTPRQLLMICGVVALIIFLLIYFTLTRLTAEKQKPVPQQQPVVKQAQVKDVTIVTAKTSIPERTLIKEEMLRLMTMPSNKVPNGALMNTADLVADIDVWLSLAEVADLYSWTRPKITQNNYVDVMLVSSQVENNKVVSEMILQNVLLLAINKQVENTSNAPAQANDKEKGKNQNAGNQPKVTGNPAMATMALVPEDALKLAAKAQLGQIYLVLRPYRPSNGISDDTYYSVTKSSGKMPVTPPPAGTIPPGADIDTSPTANVQIIRGTTTTVGR